MVAQDFGKHWLKVYIQKLKWSVGSLVPSSVGILLLCSEPLANVGKRRSCVFTRSATGADISFSHIIHTGRTKETTDGIQISKATFSASCLSSCEVTSCILVLGQTQWAA